MKSINLKRLNYSAWLTLIATYLLPYQTTDGVETTFGYPIPFISIYDKPVGKTLLMSMSVNALALIIDVLAIYILVSILMKIWSRLKKLESNH